MKQEKIILAAERRRRKITLFCVTFLVLIYFYDYPLYGFLYLYNQYQGGADMESIPGLSHNDFGMILLAMGSYLFVLLRPRDFIKSDDSGQTYFLYKKGRIEKTLLRSDITNLVFKLYEERKTSSRDSGFVGSTQIYCRKFPELVFYDAVSTYRWWYEKRVAANIQRQIGDGVQWTDKSGVFTGEESPERRTRIDKRDKQIKHTLTTKRKKAPNVVKAYGARLAFVLVFSGFGMTFAWGGFHIVAIIFGIIAALLLVDLILAWMGIGQQPKNQ